MSACEILYPMNQKIAYLLVNFGGPRNLSEIVPFLTALLQDRDVIRTRFPTFIHNWIFGRVARKRALKMTLEYEKIGGGSPIFSDTEKIALELARRLEAPVLTFHRYIPSTHSASLRSIEGTSADEIRVIPMFPQFSYATTGSVARFLLKELSRKQIHRLRWIPSYAAHAAFIGAWRRRISDFLKQQNIKEEESILLFSAHGLPLSFIHAGDIYEGECGASYANIMKYFPQALGRLSYQSKFGRGEWIKPYTDETCSNVLDWHQGRKEVILIPLSFTSDHIETLFEIEEMYLPLIREKGLNAYRCPALSLEPYWIEALAAIAQEERCLETQMLVRNALCIYI